MQRAVGTGETVPTSVRLHESMLKELDDAAAEMGLNRNTALQQLLRWALDQHERDMGRKPRPRHGPAK